MSLKWVCLDFETASGCDLKKCGAWRYAEDPTTEVLCASYEFEGTIRTWTPENSAHHTLLRDLVEDASVTFIAHNAGFEKAIWRRIMVPDFGFPDIPNSRWHDTMAVCAMKCLPQELDHATRILKLDTRKDVDGRKHTLGLSKPDKRTGMVDRSAAALQRAIDYCAHDVRAEVEMHHAIGWLPPGERRVWLLDQRINERGVRLDLEFVAAARRVVDLAIPPLAEEFAALTGGLRTGQRDKFMAWLQDQGTTLPDLKKETLAELLGDDTEDGDEDLPEAVWQCDTLPENVRRALSIRQLIGSASIKKLARMEACVGGDGRARGLLQYHGAGPGRWAGRLLQPQNFPRGSIRIQGEGEAKIAPPVDLVVDAILTGDPAYVEMVLGPPVEVVVSALRHAIVADTGRALVAGDFAGIEARIVLSLAGQWDKVALMASGAPVYEDMASVIFGLPITEADVEERQIGKNTVLGCGFQMGAPKFQSRYCKDRPLEFAQKVISAYRKEWAPAVPKLWYALENAAVRTVWERTPHEAYGIVYRLEEHWLTAQLPSGRKLWYFNPQPIRKAMHWDPTDVRQAFTYQAMKTGRWTTVEAFGGLLTENVVQATARDIMVHAMFKCEENNLPIVLTVHDEIVTEPEERYADPVALKQIMCDIPDWANALKIPVSAKPWVGQRYKK